MKQARWEKTAKRLKTRVWTFPMKTLCIQYDQKHGGVDFNLQTTWNTEDMVLHCDWLPAEWKPDGLRSMECDGSVSGSCPVIHSLVQHTRSIPFNPLKHLDWKLIKSLTDFVWLNPLQTSPKQYGVLFWRGFKRIMFSLIDQANSFLRRHTANTYRNQSTAMMRLMSSVGRPTDVSTMTMVTSPAWGIPAAPILAAVAVILMGEKCQKRREIWIAEQLWHTLNWPFNHSLVFLNIMRDKCNKNIFKCIWNWFNCQRRQGLLIN